mgnify:CR=1 FL=1
MHPNDLYFSKIKFTLVTRTSHSVTLVTRMSHSITCKGPWHDTSRPTRNRCVLRDRPMHSASDPRPNPPFMAPLRNDFSFFLNEASEVSKPNLHALVDNLTNRHQVLGDFWHMQDISHHPFLADVAQRDVHNIFYGIRSVVPGFKKLWLLRLL